MMAPHSFTTKQSTGLGRGSNRFVETRWSQVLRAAQGTDDQAGNAREELCATYWPPIYSFLRRKGHTPHDAEDLTQQFFLHILRSNVFSRADRAKGRFRSFLLGSLKRFLADNYRKASTQKRRGEIPAALVDLSRAEESYLEEHDPNLGPEQVYDRRWAATILSLAFRQLRKDFQAAQQSDRFEVLKPYLSEKGGSGEYENKGQQLGMTPRAFGVAVCRLRQRYRKLVRSLVADTLTQDSGIDEELRDLFG